MVTNNRGAINFRNNLQSKDFTPIDIPFVNPANGNDMAIDGSINVTLSELITDGGIPPSSWANQIIAGTWDPTSTTNPDTGSQCVFNQNDITDNNRIVYSAPSTVDLDNFNALRGRVRLEQFDDTQGSIVFVFFNNGNQVGNTVVADGFIDVGLLNEYQTFLIDKSFFGLDGEDVDQIQIITDRSGAATLDFEIRFDNVELIQISSGEGQVIYTVRPPSQQVMYVDQVRFTVVDDVGSTLPSNSTLALDFDDFMRLNPLTNGVLYQTVINNEIRGMIPITGLGLSLIHI